MEWDEVLICLTIVISSLLVVVVVVVERVGVAKAKQRLMTQLSHTHNLLWKLSMAQLKWNRYRYWNLSICVSVCVFKPRAAPQKQQRIAANWDESEIGRSTKVAIEEAAQSGGAFKPNLSVVSKAVVNAGVTILTTLLLRLQSCHSNSLWQIVYDIMIMLMTLVMSCNCCAWSVPRFSSSFLSAPCRVHRAPCLDWLHLSGQWDLYLQPCSRAKWTLWLVWDRCPALSCDLVRIVYGFQVCVDLCNHFMVSFALRTQLALSRPRPSTNWPRGQLLRYNCHRSQRNSAVPLPLLPARLMRPCRGLCIFRSTH